MTQSSTNKKNFNSFNSNARSFYIENGWVILSSQLSSEKCLEARQCWERMVTEYSNTIDCSLSRYLEVISQWRDLWKYDRIFFDLLTDQLSQLASASFELAGTRLLHDHFICKSQKGGNGTIPWHQDSMYWPVDRTGMSTWTPLQDTTEEHGCLEVISGSHLHGAQPPIDFMSKQNPISESTSTTLLPVKLGDIVLLHSRTWHRSAPTTSQSIRLAHIALWIPEQTRYWPLNAQWHPLNEQVSVSENDLLNEDEFPVFGGRSISKGNSFENKHQGVLIKHGMFNARDRIQSQVQEIIGKNEALTDLLSTTTQRQKVRDYVLERFPSNKTILEVERIIDNVRISSASFEKHRARNVFNSSYEAWQQLFQ
jgi:ectoine hydroxylase-related dioxygenase (phytanoyl-CoA dioxygenase family)